MMTASTRVVRSIQLCLSLLVCCVTTACSSGCGGASSGPDRFSVTGTVTRDGEPMPAGTIEFHSDSNVVGNALGHITNGHYAIPEELGPIAGTYQVRISSIAPEIAPADPNEAMAAANEPPAEEEIAARFNSQTELTAEIGPDQNNSFNFQVESSP